MESLLTLRKLAVGYPGVIILKDIEFDVFPGEIRVILGGSGCGKTTLLRTIIGLLEPMAGEIQLLGAQLNALDIEQRDHLFRKVGVLFQNGALLGSLTIAQNVGLPLKVHTQLPQKVIDELVALKLELVGLSHALQRYPSEISGGMRKRAALARALAMDPQILFCDEPSAGLDPITAAELDHLILSIRKLLGISIVVVTHELKSINTIADKVTMVGAGGMLFEGSLEQAKKDERPELQRFFRALPPDNASKSRSLLQYFTR